MARIAAIWMLVTLALQVQAATIFVNSTAGHDVWSGQCAVGPGPCGPKQTIQAAIDAASPGDVLMIASGVYAQFARTEKSLTFRGDSAQPPELRDYLVIAGGAVCTVESLRFEAGFTVLGNAQAAVHNAVADRPSGDTVDIHLDETSRTQFTDCHFVTSHLSITGSARGDCFRCQFGPTYGTAVSVHTLDVVSFDECAFENINGQVGGFTATGGTTFRNCAFRDNYGRDQSLLTGFYCRFDGCSFDSNLADSEILNLQYLTGMDRCIFTDNVGQQCVFLSVDTSANITNSVFSDNLSGLFGGALRIRGVGSARIENCTFVNNQSLTSGGAVWSFSEGVSIDSCILWENSDSRGTGERSQAYLCCDDNPIDFSIVQGWTGSLDGAFTSGENPVFVDAAHGDFRLSLNSPAIDHGNPCTQGVLDALNQPRVMNGRVDIGASESSARPFVYGDANCDGVRNNFDIDPFVLAIVNRAAWMAAFPGCDMENLDTNNDGRFDNFDIDSFIELVLCS